MERDRDAIMEHYASAVPGSLDDLGPEERHQLYKMLRLEVLAYPDKSLEVSGAILADGGGEEARERPNGGGPDDRGANRASLRGAGLGVLGPTQTSSVRRRTPRAASSPRSTTTRWPSC